jgi:large subunit ribosomal protein L10
MSKPVKDLIATELRQRYDKLDGAVVVNPVPLTGTQNNQLRGALKDKRIHMEVVKNSLAKRAFAGTPMESVCRLMEGPSALVTGGDSIVDVAREIIDWTKKLGKLEVRGALVEGQILNPEATKALSRMPTRIELQAQIVRMALSPGGQLAAAILTPGATIAGCIKALIDKLEKSGELGELVAA